MKIKLLLYLFVFGTLFTACNSDIEIPKYDQLELPYIDNPMSDPALFIKNHNYELIYGDSLIITPAIVYSNPDDLEYEWHIDKKIVSTEKDLRWQCTISEKAHCVFKIRRKSAGNSEILPFNILLDQPFERGWNVVVNENNLISYHLLREKVGNPYVYEPYEFVLRTNSKANSWVKSLEYWSNEQTVMGMMLHLDSDGMHSMNIDQIKMSPSVLLQQEFIGDELPKDVTFKDAMYCGFISYLLDTDDNLYYRKSQFGYFTGRYSPIPMFYQNAPIKVGHITSKAPYKCGLGLIFDKEKGRFLMVANYYEPRKPNLAGKIVEFPESSSLNRLQGREIVYSRVLIGANYFTGDYSFVVVTKDKGGKYRMSEYKIYLNEETLETYQELFVDEVLEDFGPNSVITVLDNPSNYGKDYFYYSSQSNPKILYSAKKTSSGIMEKNIYKEFNSEIVSIDHSKPSRTSANIGVGTANGDFYLLSLIPNMAEYIEPTESSKNSLFYKWEGLGEIKEISYRFGKVSSY